MAAQAPMAAEPAPLAVSRPVAAPARSTLFTEAPRMAAAPPAVPPPPRQSLFGIVTGALRRGPADAPARAEPETAAQAAPVAQVRPAAAELETGLEIPAFLRRQS
jgi:cell division protein FtsZ